MGVSRYERTRSTGDPTRSTGDPTRSTGDPTTPRGWVERLRGRIRERAKARPGSWWMLLALGLTSVAVGVAMLVWPVAALRTVAVVIGAWLIVAGLTRLTAALLDRSAQPDRRRLSAFVGVACLVAGGVFLGNAKVTLGLLALILALQWLVGGIADIVAGVRSHRPERGWLVALGVLSCLAGAVFLVWPALSLLTFTVLAAVSAIGIGVLDVTAGLRLRRFARSLPTG